MVTLAIIAKDFIPYRTIQLPYVQRDGEFQFQLALLRIAFSFPQLKPSVPDTVWFGDRQGIRPVRDLTPAIPRKIPLRQTFGRHGQTAGVISGEIYRLVQHKSEAVATAVAVSVYISVATVMG